MAVLFDHYVIVDWSAANQKKKGRDSIWICHRGPNGERCANPSTRRAARDALIELLTDAVASRQRVLLGFDFPFGYPVGFAAKLCLDGLPWRAVWDEISRLIEDDGNNKNNRFKVGAELNRRVSQGRFPFWGCPVGFTDQYLAPTHHHLHTENEPLRERRLIDDWMVGAQPCWKLAYAGSVGSQSLTGIPVVRALRDDPRWADRARVWPFETGLDLPDEARIVFAEVWPSWWPDWKKMQQPGEVNDSAQVRNVAQVFAERDEVGELRTWFAGDPGLSDEQRRQVETEEAWTLGVTARRSAVAKLVAPALATPSSPATRGPR